MLYMFGTNKQKEKLMKKKYEIWLDILNDVSVMLECYIATEQDKQRIHDLDSVIDGIYELMKKAEKKTTKTTKGK